METIEKRLGAKVIRGLYFHNITEVHENYLGRNIDIYTSQIYGLEL